MSARFVSILNQLNFPDESACSLCIGCGNFPEFEHLIARWPAWKHIGIDVDLHTLKRAPRASTRIAADGRRIPFRQKFSLLVIRHPNIAEKRAAWGELFRDAAHCLAEGGLLLVTTYELDEVEFARSAVPLRRIPLDESQTAPTDLVGRDRFVLIFRQGAPR